MPDLFDPVRALYGEARPDGTVPSRNDLSDAARAELEALAPVKAALDAQPSQAPDAAVLAAILDAARVAAVSGAPPATPRAADRAPVRSSRSRRARVALPVLALFVCGAVGLSVFLQQPSAELATESVAEAPISAAPALDVAPALETATEAIPEAASRELLAQGEELRLEEAAAPSISPSDTGSPEAPVASAPATGTLATDDVPASQTLAVNADQLTGDVAASDAGEAAPAAAFVEAARTAAPSARAVQAPAPRVRMRATAGTQPGVALVAAEPVAWDTDDEDLRLLSLRLQTLRESNEGLAWDEPPVPLSGGAALQGLDLTSDTVHDETRVGFHAVPQRTGWIRVQQGGQ